MEKKYATRKGFRRTWLDAVYEWKTPLFDRYYREARKHIHFFRHYKRALNW
jgi:hypothetical protein